MRNSRFEMLGQCSRSNVLLDEQFRAPHYLRMRRKSSRVFVEEDLQVLEIVENTEALDLDRPDSSNGSAAYHALIAPMPSLSTLPSVSQRYIQQRDISFNTDQVSTKTNSARVSSSSLPVDWYGNSTLHQAFARLPFNLEEVRNIIIQSPHFVKQKNQFGRLPLHYALDRSKVSEPALRMLLQRYPEAVAQPDVNGDRPYDVAVRWQHNRTIMWLLLESCPAADNATYVKLKYGPLGTLALWASGTRSQCTAQECTEEDNEDNINASSSSSHNATTQPLTDFVNGDDSLSQLGHIEEDSLLDDAVLQGVLQEGLEENRVRAMSDV